MNNSSTILTVLLLSWICAGTATAQDELPERKNAISVSLLPLLDRTISVTYARKLKNGKELTINPRFQQASTNVATEPATDQGSNHRFLFKIPDPQWYYDHYQLRIGLRIPINNVFSYEPQLQLAYGQFSNKVIETEDSEGDAYDEYLRLDRRYFSTGILNTVNWTLDFNRFRLKTFAGIGAHFKMYKEMQYNRYIWYRNDNSFEPHSEKYAKGRLSLHAGIEVGFRF